MWTDKLHVTQQSISFYNYLFSWKTISPDGTPDFEIKESLARIWCPQDHGTVLVSNTVQNNKPRNCCQPRKHPWENNKAKQNIRHLLLHHPIRQYPQQTTVILSTNDQGLESSLSRSKVSWLSWGFQSSTARHQPILISFFWFLISIYVSSLFYFIFCLLHTPLVVYSVSWECDQYRQKKNRLCML